MSAPAARLAVALSSVGAAGAVGLMAHGCRLPAAPYGSDPRYHAAMSAAQLSAIASIIVAVAGLATAIGAVIHSRNTRGMVGGPTDGAAK